MISGIESNFTFIPSTKLSASYVMPGIKVGEHMIWVVVLYSDLLSLGICDYFMRLIDRSILRREINTHVRV